jgi:hypothetical protein
MQNINRLLQLIFAVLVSLQLIGCEEDKGPITSNEITIVVNSINESDINEDGILEKDENISNDSGNPWGEFIKDAEAECGGNPDRFEIVSITVQISDQVGVTNFEDVIFGNASVHFLSTQGSDLDAVRVTIGSNNNLTGISANELTNMASSSDLNSLRDRLLGGDFHVGFRGETDLTKDDTFSMDVIIKFVVKAHCD